MKIKTKKGFTLTELIVVIAIIGILAAVLIPSITGYIKKAQISSDQQDARNMNQLLQNAAIYYDIDLDDLQAPDIIYLVNSEEKNYSFQPKAKGGVFWFDETTNEIIYTNKSAGINATSSGTPTQKIEDINNDGKLYLNSSGELATFLRNIRLINCKEDFDSLVEKSKTSIEGYNLGSLINKYDPSTTLFINSNGGFTMASNNSYSNKPQFGSLTGLTIIKSDGTSVIPEFTVSNTVIIELDSIKYSNNIVYEQIYDKTQQNCWVFKYNNNGTEEFYYLSEIPVKKSIDNIIYASDLKVIRQLNLSNSVYFDSIIKLPYSVELILKDSFTEIKGDCTIESQNKSVQIINGATNQNITTNLKVVEESNVFERAFLGNSKIKVYLGQNSLVGEKSLSELLNKGVSIKEYVFDTNQPKTIAGAIYCFDISNKPLIGTDEEKYKYFIDTSELMKAFPTIKSLDVTYMYTTIAAEKDGGFAKGGTGLEIRILAFDEGGLVVNLGINFLTNLK